MAEINFKPTTVSNLEAPDITKAGALFSNALKNIGQNIQDYQTGRQEAGVDRFQNALRQAKSQEELALLQQNQLPELTGLGVDPTQVGALEQGLRQKQTSILGSTLQEEHDDFFTNSLPKIQDTHTNKLTPEERELVAVGPGGTILEAKPDLKKGITQDKITAAARRFAELLDETGYKALPTDRELKQQITERAKGFNLPKENINALTESFFAYKKGKETLNEQEQNIVDQDAATLDTEFKIKLSNLNKQKQADINSLRMSPETANLLQQTTWKDVFQKVNKEAGEDLGLTDFYDWLTGKGAGAALKEYIIKNYKDKKFEGKEVQPWMVAEAIDATIQRDSDGRAMIDSDALWELFGVTSGPFHDYIKDLVTGDRVGEIQRAFELPFKYDQEQALLEADLNATKLRRLAIWKDSFDIRDTKANRDFQNKYLPRAEAALVKEQARVQKNNDTQESDQQQSSQQSDQQQSSVIAAPVIFDDLPPTVEERERELNDINYYKSLPIDDLLSIPLEELEKIDPDTAQQVIGLRANAREDNGLNRVLEKNILKMEEDRISDKIPTTTQSTQQSNTPSVDNTIKIKDNTVTDTKIEGLGKTIDQSTDNKVLTGLSTQPVDYIRWLRGIVEKHGDSNDVIKKILNHPKIKGNQTLIEKLREAWKDNSIVNDQSTVSFDLTPQNRQALLSMQDSLTKQMRLQDPIERASSSHTLKLIEALLLGVTPQQLIKNGANSELLQQLLITFSEKGR